MEQVLFFPHIQNWYISVLINLDTSLYGNVERVPICFVVAMVILKVPEIYSANN